MSETENIEIIVSFGKNGISPRMIKLGRQTYRIAQVSLIHAIKEGLTRIYFFSVSDGVNFWKLGFNTESLRWWVEDFYVPEN